MLAAGMLASRRASALLARCKFDGLMAYFWRDFMQLAD